MLDWWNNQELFLKIMYPTAVFFTLVLAIKLALKIMRIVFHEIPSSGKGIKAFLYVDMLATIMTAFSWASIISYNIGATVLQSALVGVIVCLVVSIAELFINHFFSQKIDQADNIKRHQS